MSPPRRATPTAFTLIELMVSIAIVLILVLGIHQVFKLTSDTVGAGQGLGSKARDFRAVQSTFYNDLSMTVPPQASTGRAGRRAVLSHPLGSG